MQFNLTALFQQYFGMEGANDPGQPFFVGQTLSTPAEVATSVSGVPIYEQISLGLQTKGVTVLDYTFPGWPLMTLEFGWIIKKTQVTDLPGQVKEYIGEDDVDITIRGLLINNSSYAAPLDQKVALKAACKTKQTLKVTCETLNALDIHYLVVRKLSFPEVEAQLQVQPFVIECDSDYPYELVIQDAVAAKTLTAQQKARQLLLGQ